MIQGISVCWPWISTISWRKRHALPVALLAAIIIIFAVFSVSALYTGIAAQKEASTFKLARIENILLHEKCLALFLTPPQKQWRLRGPHAHWNHCKPNRTLNSRHELWSSQKSYSLRTRGFIRLLDWGKELRRILIQNLDKKLGILFLVFALPSLSFPTNCYPNNCRNRSHLSGSAMLR